MMVASSLVMVATPMVMVATSMVIVPPCQDSLGDGGELNVMVATSM